MPIISGSGSGSSALTTVDATLAALVTIVNANTYYDGPSASFATGTWFIVWKMMFQVTGSTVQTYAFTAKLWDGTTVYDEGEYGNPVSAANTGWPFTLAGCAVVTLAAPATLKISGCCNHGSSVSEIAIVPPDNGNSTKTATRLSGVKVA